MLPMTLDSYLSALDRMVEDLPSVLNDAECMDEALLEAHAGHIAWLLDLRDVALQEAGSRWMQVSDRVTRAVYALLSETTRVERLLGISPGAVVPGLAAFSPAAPCGGQPAPTDLAA